MTDRREMRLRNFAQDPRLDFIEEKDRYVFNAPEPQFRLGLIGCGTMGLEHLRVAQMEGQAPITAIYDNHAPSIAQAQREQEVLGVEPLRLCESMEALCNDPQIDAVIIATPNYTHWSVLQVAMQSGKPVLLEKPMATNLQDGIAMVKAVQSYTAPVILGLQYRYKAIYAEVLRQARNPDLLGELHNLRMAEYRPPFLDKVAQWNKFNAQSGGTLVEKCCHYFDLLNHLARSTPKRIFASGGQAVNFRQFTHDGKASDIMDNAEVIIDYHDGKRASFSLNMFSPVFREELILSGDKGHLCATETVDFMSRGDHENHLHIWRGEHGGSISCQPSYTQAITASGHGGASYYLHKKLVDMLHGRPHDLATIADGFAALIVGIAAQRSIETGYPVDINALLCEHGGDMDMLTAT